MIALRMQRCARASSLENQVATCNLQVNDAHESLDDEQQEVKRHASKRNVPISNSSSSKLGLKSWRYEHPIWPDDIGIDWDSRRIRTGYNNR